ncbi:uncharacterized protein LOC129717005 [Wyeomyia smithii]|uniref:uncharacterized protein LOC129717005 n=1 Tax=Wyeomyia smithii TaxID=174621 RepID=UPI002467F579|nr:uncharacterized protein LOC129717005 [Wyeomyia smithii]
MTLPPGDSGGQRAPDPVKYMYFNCLQKTQGMCDFFSPLDQSIHYNAIFDKWNGDDYCEGFTLFNNSCIFDTDRDNRDSQRLHQYNSEDCSAFDSGEYQEADFISPSSAPPLSQQCNPSDLTKGNQDVLRIFYQNVRGLRTKIDDVYLAISENDYDVYVLTETWLDSRINSLQLFGDSYTVFRTDRNSNNSVRQRGGGVLIAFSTSFVCSQITEVVPVWLETLLVKIAIDTQHVFIAVLYIPPEKRLDCDVMRAQLEVFEAATTRMRTQDTFLILGDFNQPNLVWKNYAQDYAIADPVESVFTPASRTLLDGVAFLGLRQKNVVCNHQSRCLDLVFVNKDCCSNCLVSEAPETIAVLDVFHPALCVELTAQRIVEFLDEQNLNQLDYRRTNTVLLRDLLLQVDWSVLEQFTDVNDAVAFYNQIMMDCVLIAVPPRRAPRKPPWSNGKLRHMKRIRARALRAYTRQRCPFLKHSFTIASNRYRNYNKFLYNLHVRSTQQSLRQNPRKFWKFVNTKRKQTAYLRLYSSMV